MSRRRLMFAALVLLTPASAGAGLVEKGRLLFAEETFAGNGRTCASCHPPENDFTLDPAYIKRLPSSDPLFVHEHNPALKSLDNALLLRKLALITVNADGFDKPPVARGVQHLLGLNQTMAAEPFGLILPDTGVSLVAALGWSGDGGPGNGSLSQFIKNAVRQHMPKTLARREGIDFRLPTSFEVKALRAYLLSLGRRDEIDISNEGNLRFRSKLVERGRVLFHEGRSGPCSFCHTNAGALGESGFNQNFDTGAAGLTDTPARRLVPALPGDGGFGSMPEIEVAGRTGFGDRRMNTPSIIEAADTLPLFHNNAFATIEEAVRFYTTEAFARSLDGETLPPIELNGAEVIAIASLLRTLNALENVRSVAVHLKKTLGKDTQAGSALIRLALKDTQDAIRVLSGGPRRLYPSALRLLRHSLNHERRALRTLNPAKRDALLDQVLVLQAQAKRLMVSQERPKP